MNTGGHGSGNGGTARKAYLIEGRVQGVGFRWWTTRNARALGLRGTVRNRRDGRVELHVTGPEEAIRELEARLREGPSAARVSQIEEISPADDLPRDFRIIR